MPTPTPTRIEDYLASLPKEPLHYHQHRGNAGDALITLGAFQSFQRAGVDYRILRPDDDLAGKTLVFSGGGSLVSLYGEAAGFLREAYPKVKRLIVLPHTITGNEDLLSSLGGNADILCRELRSYEYVRSLNSRCNVYLAEDLAFSINIDEALAGAFRPRFPDPHVEQTGVRYYYELARANLRYRRECSRRLARYRRRRATGGPEARGMTKTLNCFREDPEKTDIPIPPDNIDVSNTFSTPFGLLGEASAARVARSLLRFLKGFDQVNTNRLHVAIAAAMLGKRVELHGNNYFKIEAIYNLSLKDKYPNVRWAR